jgi:hypothetical protein
MAQVPGTETLYPLTSTDRQAIPLDIVDIRGLMRESFTDTTGAARTIPDEADFLILTATEDCYVQFDMSAAAEPAEGDYQEDLVFIPGGSQKVIARKDYTTFAVIRAGITNGKLIIEMGRLWQDLRKTIQSTNQG